MNDPVQFWADPRLVYSVAAAAVALLLITVWLFGRRRRQGRQAAVVCLLMSIGLHIALIFLVPLMSPPNGGSSSADPTTDEQAGIDTVQFSTFDPDINSSDASADQPESQIAPLPVANLTDLLDEPTDVDPETEAVAESENNVETETPELPPLMRQRVPDSLATQQTDTPSDMMAEIESELGDMLENAFESEPAAMTADIASAQSQPSTAQTPPQVTQRTSDQVAARTVATSTAPTAMVPGELKNDFANRVGKAKEVALQQTGGNVNTEAAVKAALRFLADAQRADGAWDPRSSGAGREQRQVLGVSRPGTGSRAESAITGLALLTLMGAGQTHHQGEYADNVYRGLSYLIGTQKPNGSLAGQASPYAANYSHGMAALSICEAAAITQDASAVASAKRSVRFTISQQHPTTGGWRYIPGDPGDLSQLGWQAMVLDAGHRAQIQTDRQAVAGIQRFLNSVRKGQTGGLASYRPDELPSRTMTAEALATRLLIGQRVPNVEVAEAERYLLQQPPGVGKDNYYYWYYATLALHQLQDDAWKQWNEALQRRLLATQRPDGSWPSDTMWGSYGGTVYTTAMATLCLEVYYRHAIRSDNDRIANRPSP